MGLILNLVLQCSRADASSGPTRARDAGKMLSTPAPRRGNARGPEGTANAPYGRSCPRSAAFSAGVSPIRVRENDSPGRLRRLPRNRH